VDCELNSSEKESIVQLYENRLEQYGASHKTVGWGSGSSQELRFFELFREIDPRRLRILDVGCGLGDLVPFLDKTTKGDYEYVGIDIAPALVDKARELHGADNRSFVCGDLLEWQDEEIFDIAVLSGALNFRVADNQALAEAVLHRMFEKTTQGVCANFLSSYVDYELPKNFHYKPETLFAFARTLSKRTRLNHDYPLWEFTLQIFHNQEPSQ